MNELFKVVLSLSLSGSLLILVLLLSRPLYRNRLSRWWQHAIWLLVIVRLLLPFGMAQSLVGTIFEQLEAAASGEAVPTAPAAPKAPQISASAEKEGQLSPPNLPAAPVPSEWLREAWAKAKGYAGQYLWAVWLGTAAILLIRRLTAYQSFAACLKAGRREVSDPEMLDRLAEAAAQAGVRRPMELWVNPMAASPMLMGFFHPCIVLPSEFLSPEDLRCTLLHELAHYRRGDLFCKWLMQLTLCLHWFNPLVWLAAREMDRACELACDEAVLGMLTPEERRGYGEMLLRAAEAGGCRKDPSVALHSGAALLKERLGAIMTFKKSSKFAAVFALLLTAALTAGAAAAGAYSLPGPKQPASQPAAGQPVKTAPTPKKDTASQAEQYYKAGSLPLFQIAFSKLDEKAQTEWLDRIYKDGSAAFFNLALEQLQLKDDSAVKTFAQRAYDDDNISFFSILAGYMEESSLELWLDRAAEDEKWAFQSVLFDALDRGGEFDELEKEKEKEWAEAQKAEYQAAGVTMDGKSYYYQGQLVNIFLDIRANQSFYTLNIDPAGTVSIKITRSADNKIAGVAYMTEAEAAELLEDMSDDDEEAIPVDLKTLAAGETVFLGEYTLSLGDQICYDISAEAGKGMQVYFAKDEQKNVVYWSVHNLRQKGEPLEISADFTVKAPAEPGRYKLYLKASDGALGDVKGNVFIAFTGEQ